MKKVKLGISMIIFSIAAYASALWVVVSFLIYLVKDVPFNWNSVLCAFICWVAVIFLVALTAYTSVREIKNKKPIAHKSRFQERLERAKEINAN